MTMNKSDGRSKTTPMLRTWIIWMLLAGMPGAFVLQADDAVLFREEFKNLDAWEPYFFSSISRHSSYEVQTLGASTVLMATSNNSASALLCKQAFNIAEFPILHWQWKVDNIYAKGNYRIKSGDDYPIRLYVFFAYDPKTATAGMKLKYGMARAISGRYPPLRSLNYIWANREDETTTVPSPFTEKSIMIPLRHGPQKIGQWVAETVNLLEDYRRAFGEEPPPEASLAIMNDSDNTGESATAYVGFIEVRKSGF